MGIEKADFPAAEYISQPIDLFIRFVVMCILNLIVTEVLTLVAFSYR